MSGDPNPELTARRRSQVLQMTREGKSTREISQILGITDRQVTRIRRSTGCATGESGVPVTKDALAKAADLFEDGCSYAEVARTIGCSVSTIRKYFPGKGWTRQESYDHIATLRRCKIRLDERAGVFFK